MPAEGGARSDVGEALYAWLAPKSEGDALAAPRAALRDALFDDGASTPTETTFYRAAFLAHRAGLDARAGPSI
jgi:hypothetical protein